MTKYSDNYSDTSRSSRQFKRDDVPADEAGLIVNNSQSLKYKAAIARKTETAMNVNNVVNSSVKKHKNSRSIKTFKQFLEITRNLIKDCILLSAENSAKFEITDANFHVSIIILSTKDNVNLTKQLRDGFRRSVY